MQKSTFSIRSLVIVFLTIMPHASWSAAYGMPVVVEAEFSKYVNGLGAQIKGLAIASVATSFFSSMMKATNSPKGAASTAPATPKKENKLLDLDAHKEKAAYLKRYFANKALMDSAITQVASNPPQFIIDAINEFFALPVHEQTSDRLAEIIHRKNVQNFGLPVGATYQQLEVAVTAKNPDKSYVISDALYFQNTTAALLVLHLKDKMK